MSLIDDLVKLEEEAKELVTSADDAAKLEAARVELLGRKGRITGLMRMMGKLAPEDRPMMGKRACTSALIIRSSSFILPA